MLNTNKHYFYSVLLYLHYYAIRNYKQTGLIHILVIDTPNKRYVTLVVCRYYRWEDNSKSEWVHHGIYRGPQNAVGTISRGTNAITDGIAEGLKQSIIRTLYIQLLYT